MKRRLLFTLLAAAAFAAPTAIAQARVVINELMYHAPSELDDLQFVELHNTADNSVDLEGWEFTKGIKFRFPAGARIDARGFIVLCRDESRFKEFYNSPIAGVFSSKISRKGERIELSDAAGRQVDSVKFSDSPPWPSGADGHSGSLERIHPETAGDDPANWRSSPLSEDREKPSGTPGQPNRSFSRAFPPVIAKVTFSPELPAQNQAIQVRAELRAGDAATGVALLYRLAGPGFEKPEARVPMTKTAPGRYTAAIPGQSAGQLIRFRVEAANAEGATRFFPGETEPRPALSAYVPESFEPAQIPFAWIIHTNEKEMNAAETRAAQPAFGGFMPPRRDPQAEARETARLRLEEQLDLSPLWLALAAKVAAGDPSRLVALRPVMVAALAERKRLMNSTLEGPGLETRLQTLPETARRFAAETIARATPLLTPPQQQALARWVQSQPQSMPPGERMITRRADLEGAWHALSLNAELDPARLPALLAALQDLDRKRTALMEEVASGAGKETAFRDQRSRAEELGEQIQAALAPHLSAAQARQLAAWKDSPREVTLGFRTEERVPAGPTPGFGGGGRGGPGFGGRGSFGGRFRQAPAERGSYRSAFVYYDPAARQTQLFDFVQINGRKGGQKVHFYRDRPLGEMTTIALIFEGDTASLVEPLAYEVYRRAGLPVEQSRHVRLWQDGKPAGYTVQIEQPNRAFLRRNKINDDGNMYKLLWFGSDLIEQHEKHSNRRQGHEDIIEVIEGLEKSSAAPNDQWEFIRRRFDVEQVAGYFAVNMVLSHWDGFFNNYFAYHDAGGTGKWMMFPWDQDSTWGLRGSRGNEVFHTMALTFGMNGDRRPSDGAPWRGPGWFSGPLLANPQFRQVFLARTKHILETVYTEAAFGPILDRLLEQLTPEVKIRAEIQNQDPERAVERLRSEIDRCREHLRKRREFLLAQEELARLGKKQTRPSANPSR